MSDTDKKLDALIDALGFDVEVVTKLDKVRYAYASAASNVSKQDFTYTEFKFTKRDGPDVSLNGSPTVSMDEYERDYGYMAQIKGLVKESGIPKSVIIDLIEAMPNE